MVRARRWGAAGVALLVAVTIGGCMEVPVLSTPESFSTKSNEVLLRETVRQVDDLAVFLGGKWNVLGQQDVPWDPTDLSGWAPGSCGMKTELAQYAVDIERLEHVADPLAWIEKVRGYWNRLGYHEISQFGPQADDEGTFVQIAVDLPAKAGLQFNVSSTGMGIGGQSPCAYLWSDSTPPVSG